MMPFKLLCEVWLSGFLNHASQQEIFYKNNPSKHIIPHSEHIRAYLTRQYLLFLLKCRFFPNLSLKQGLLQSASLIS